MSSASLSRPISTAPEKIGIGVRIAQVRGALSRDKFATLFGLHRNTIIRYEQELAYPDALTIRMICEHFGVDESWLIRGNGIKGSPTVVTTKGLTSKELASSNPFVSLPVLDTSEADAETVAPIAVRESWVREFLRTSDSAFFTEMKDDTMKGTIDPGDYVLAIRVHGIATRDAPYVLDMNGRVSVRRIQLLPDGDYRVKCDNLDYESVTIKDAKSVRLYGIVCAVLHRC